MIIIDGAAMLDGAFLLFCGAVIGRVTKKKGRKDPKSPKPVCGCGHHLAFHDPETRACHGMMDGNATQFDDWDAPVAWEQIPCTCRQYSGPEAVPEFFAPEITA